MPRNWFMGAVAAGSDAVVPTTTPSAITAVGRGGDLGGPGLAMAAPAVAVRMRREGSIVRQAWGVGGGARRR